MAPTAIRERRRILRYRHLLVRKMVQAKNKIAVLLMEAGISYNKQRLHTAGDFRELLPLSQQDRIDSKKLGVQIRRIYWGLVDRKLQRTSVSG